jgi:hypothetical protein
MKIIFHTKLKGFKSNRNKINPHTRLEATVTGK